MGATDDGVQSTIRDFSLYVKIKRNRKQPAARSSG
jgi:hypothetical protein